MGWNTTDRSKGRGSLEPILSPAPELGPRDRKTIVCSGMIGPATVALLVVGVATFEPACVGVTLGEAFMREGSVTAVFMGEVDGRGGDECGVVPCKEPVKLGRVGMGC